MQSFGVSGVDSLIRQNVQYPYRIDEVVLGQYAERHPWYPGWVIERRECSDDGKVIKINWVDPEKQWKKEDQVTWLQMSSVIPFTVDNVESCNNEFAPKIV